MDYKVLYRKYRPKNFDEVVGQDYTIQMLKNAYNDNKLSHAFIFTGPRGTGKTSTAKLLAKLINCENPVDGKPCEKCFSCLNYHDNPDVVEIDAASNTGVDNIREIINNAKIAPSFSKYKVYIIDEVHMLSTSAFNALLLTLEEPPQNIIFILATTEIQNVPVTILSRCQRFDFNRISTDKIYDTLLKACKIENINIEEDALMEVASLADGGLRDAYSILDQVSKSNETITLDDIHKNFGIISESTLSDLINSIENNDSNRIIEIIDTFKSSSINYLTALNKIINYLEKQARLIKTNQISGNFDLYKNLIFELSTLFQIKNMDNPYALLLISLLKYTNDNNKNYFPGNNLSSVENQSDLKENLENMSNNHIVINKETKIEEKTVNTDLSEFVKIRINNTFVEANKSYKSQVMDDYNNFISSSSNPYILNLLADSSIAMASNKYAVIIVKKDSIANNINNDINVIEDEYNKSCNSNLRFVAITDDYWQKIMNEFKLNKNKKYEYIDENVKNDNVFDNSILEIV